MAKLPKEGSNSSNGHESPPGLLPTSEGSGQKLPGVLMTLFLSPLPSCFALLQSSLAVWKTKGTADIQLWANEGVPTSLETLPTHGGTGLGPWPLFSWY